MAQTPETILPDEYIPQQMKGYTPDWLRNNPMQESVHNALQKLEESTRYLSGADRLSLGQVVDIAAYLHRDQTRLSKEPYVTHAIEVAIILAQHKANVSTLNSGLLHDTVEDCSNGNREEFEVYLRSQFGDRVMNPVMLVTKPQDIRRKLEKSGQDVMWVSEQYEEIHMKRNTNLSVKEQYHELYKLLLLLNSVNESSTSNHLIDTELDAINADMIKLADRLTNMRTLRALPKGKQLENARETLEIYVPLAKRLGVWDIANELGDLSYPYVYSEKKWKLLAFQTVSKNLKPHAEDIQRHITTHYVPASFCDNPRITTDVIIPNAASMCDNDAPFIILNIGVAPEQANRKNPTKDFSEVRDALDILQNHFSREKNVQFPDISTVMTLIKKHILNTVSLTYPIFMAQYPGVYDLHINVMPKITQEEDSVPIYWVLQHTDMNNPEERNHYKQALHKWRHIQGHFREYRGMFRDIFSMFSSAELFLALTQRAPTGMMFVIGVPPDNDPMPWLIKRGATLKDFIDSVVGANHEHGIVVRVKGEIQVNWNKKLSPFDAITIQFLNK